jgi:hypothetical protein
MLPQAGASSKGRFSFPHMESRKRKPGIASQLIGLGGRHPDPEVLRTRFAERDRQASDDRTPVQKWLGDPPPDRSALANKTR